MAIIMDMFATITTILARVNLDVDGDIMDINLMCVTTADVWVMALHYALTDKKMKREIQVVEQIVFTHHMI